MKRKPCARSTTQPTEPAAYLTARPRQLRAIGGSRLNQEAATLQRRPIEAEPIAQRALQLSDPEGDTNVFVSRA